MKSGVFNPPIFNKVKIGYNYNILGSLKITKNTKGVLSNFKCISQLQKSKRFP